MNQILYLLHPKQLVALHRQIEPNLAKLLYCFLPALIVDGLFAGFSAAYAYSQGGLAFVLMFVAIQSSLGFVGYYSSFLILRKSKNYLSSLLMLSMGAYALIYLTAGVLENSMLAVAVLAMGGVSRGLFWAGRQLAELECSGNATRDRYVSVLTAWTTLAKIIFPLLAAGVLLMFENDTQKLFLVLSGISLLLTKLMAGAPAVQPPPPPTLFKTMRKLGTGVDGAFFAMEGTGATLRTVLYISGVVAVVQSTTNYGFVDAGASALSIVALLWAAKHPNPENRLARVKASMLMIAGAWLCLLGSLSYPWLFALFVSCYVLGYPMLTSVKHSLVLGSLSANSSGDKANNALAREGVLLVSRLVAIALAGGLVMSAPSPQAALAYCVSLLLILAPLEYWASIKIHHRTMRGA